MSPPLLRRLALGLLLVLAVAGAVAAQEPAAPTVAPPPKDPSEKMIPETPWEVLKAMGYLFSVPLVASSIVAFWFAIERLVVLRRARVIPKAFVKRFFQHLEQGKLDPKAALRLCEENGSPVALVFAHGLRKWGKPSVEIEQAIIDGGERQISRLRTHLRVLNGVATITPLIGLLGTVVGMIGAFNQMASTAAMGQTERLAGNIGLALLTTAAGLIIAIPALIMYMYLAGRVDALVVEMDQLAQRLVDLISAEALADQSRPARAPAPKSAADARRAV